jgi:hypothetical protein
MLLVYRRLGAPHRTFGTFAPRERTVAAAQETKLLVLAADVYLGSRR